MTSGPSFAAVAAVQARIAHLAAPPQRVTQLEDRFDALLSRAVGAGAPANEPAANGAAAAESGAPSTFMSAATYLAATVPAATSSGSTAAAAGAWTKAPALGEARIISVPTASTPVGSAGPSALAATGGPITPVAPRGGWVDRVPNQRGKDLAPYIQGVADRYGLDPALLAAVFWTESSYRADAVSSAGAVGLGQLMPGTAATLGVDPWDPMQNMDGSARLYRYLIDKYGGDLELAISAYACGEGAVARAGGVPSDFARGYITKLLGRRDYLAGTRPSPP